MKDCTGIYNPVGILQVRGETENHPLSPLEMHYHAKIREGTGGTPAGFFSGYSLDYSVRLKAKTNHPSGKWSSFSESLVEIGHLRNLNVYGDACVTSLGSASCRDLSDIAVPSGRSVHAAFLAGVDPVLELDVVGFREALRPVMADGGHTSVIGAHHCVRRLGEIEDAFLADDLAADIVSVVGEYEGLDFDVCTGLCGQVHDLGILAVSGVSGAAGEYDVDFRVVLAEQPAEAVDLMDHGVLNRHGGLPADSAVIIVVVAAVEDQGSADRHGKGT